MKKTAGIASLISGILLLLIPRFILPVCEYEGYRAMHCSDTARAEQLIGALLIAGGAGILLLRKKITLLIALGGALLLSLAAYAMPDVYGYCRSPKMPCNYGTVPAVRLVAVLTGVTALLALGTLIKSAFRKGPPS